jgi:UPF0271 protein
MSSRTAININVDMGESLGNYAFGHDEALIDLVPTVNVACGFHAGDPDVMRHTVSMAVERGVEIGAHVGLPDVLGFGRRRMDLRPEQLRDYTVYQVGALDAFVRSAGARLTHVKPHGALYSMVAERGDLARALVDAVSEIELRLALIAGGVATAEYAAERGIAATGEGYVDLDYNDNAMPVIEPKKLARDPEETARRALRLAKNARAISAESGAELHVEVPTICLHSDAPNAVDAALAVRRALERGGVSIVGLATAMASG